MCIDRVTLLAPAAFKANALRLCETMSETEWRRRVRLTLRPFIKGPAVVQFAITRLPNIGNSVQLPGDAMTFTIPLARFFWIGVSIHFQ